MCSCQDHILESVQLCLYITMLYGTGAGVRSPFSQFQYCLLPKLSTVINETALPFPSNSSSFTLSFFLSWHAPMCENTWRSDQLKRNPNGRFILYLPSALLHFIVQVLLLKEGGGIRQKTHWDQTTSLLLTNFKFKEIMWSWTKEGLTSLWVLEQVRVLTLLIAEPVQVFPH